MTDPPAAQTEAPGTALTCAYEKEVAAIRAMPDRQQAFEAATKLGERISDLRTETGALRAEIASEIYRAESLSLAGLANRIGVSRGRAQDLIEAARAAEEGKTNE